jgi:hypothetical protein
MYNGDWVVNRKLILQIFDSLTPTITTWAKTLGFDLEELLDYLNGKKFKVDYSVYNFFHSHLLDKFADHDSGKSPAFSLQ